MFEVFAFVILSLLRYLSANNRVSVIGFNDFNRNRIARFQFIVRQPV